MKDNVRQSGLGAATLRQIAAEAAAAYEGGGPQMQPASARYLGLTMDDAYRVTALAHDLRVTRGYRPAARSASPIAASGTSTACMPRSGATCTTAPYTSCPAPPGHSGALPKGVNPG
jgi:hypothetical protein